MPTAHVNGITLYYEVHGAGRPLLLIGGLGSDVTLFRAIIPGMARHHQVIAFDNRGAGRSDKPDIPYTIAMMAQDAVELLDALNAEQADVMGVSMGGRIALELTLSHPSRVDHLVLVSTAAAGRGKVSMSVPMRAVRQLARVGLLRRKYQQPDYAHQRQRQASLTYDALERLGQIHAPTLIAHGRRDRSIPLELAERTHSRIAGSEIEVFRGGHMFFVLPERQRLLDRVELFLGAQRAAAAADAVPDSGEYGTAASRIRIWSQRVLLRALRPDEIDAEWQDMVTADPMAIVGLPDEAQFRARLARSGRLEDGWLDLAVDADGTSIGRIQTFVPAGRPLPTGTFDVGIGLREEARGMGYGREALALLTDWLFEHAAAEVVEAPTDPANMAMRTVFDRVGWELAGPHEEAGREWVMYRITRGQWQAQRSAAGA